MHNSHGQKSAGQHLRNLFIIIGSKYSYIVYSKSLYNNLETIARFSFVTFCQSYTMEMKSVLKGPVLSVTTVDMNDSMPSRILLRLCGS